jgi:protein TonB
MDEPVTLFATSVVNPSGISTSARGAETTVANLLPTAVVDASAPPPPPPPKVKAPPMRVGGEVQASRIIRQVNPVYPEAARRSRTQGVVVVEVEVDEDGNVTTAVATDGPALLRPAAVDAVRQWVYSPTLLNGEPVPVSSTVRVTFSLN